MLGLSCCKLVSKISLGVSLELTDREMFCNTFQNLPLHTCIFMNSVGRINSSKRQDEQELAASNAFSIPPPPPPPPPAMWSHWNIAKFKTL